MDTFAIAALQLGGQRGSNIDSMIEEIDTVKRRFPWVQMVVAGELIVVEELSHHVCAIDEFGRPEDPEFRTGNVAAGKRVVGRRNLTKRFERLDHLRRLSDDLGSELIAPLPKIDCQ